MLLPLLVLALAPVEGEPPPSLRVVVLAADANEAGAAQAGAVGSLLAAQLAEAKAVSLVGPLEPRGDGSGCAQPSCLAEVAERTGARFVVQPRVDRFGQQYVLTAALFDAQSASIPTRAKARAASDEVLPDAVGELSAALQRSFSAAGGQPGPVARMRPTRSSGKIPARPVALALKVGSTFFATLATLSPGGDLEVGFRFREDWVAFAQVGVNVVRSTATTGERGGLNVLPSMVGLRHLYLTEGRFQPFWSLGLGVSLSFGQFGFLSETGPLPTVLGAFGCQYLFTDHFGLMVEASTNVAQGLLGLTRSGLGSGLNLDLSGGLVGRF